MARSSPDCAWRGRQRARREHDATPSGRAFHYLREPGALLAIEIEDTLYAIHNRGVVLGRAHGGSTPGGRRCTGRDAELFSSAKARGRPLDLGG